MAILLAVVIEAAEARRPTTLRAGKPRRVALMMIGLRFRWQALWAPPGGQLRRPHVSASECLSRSFARSCWKARASLELGAAAAAGREWRSRRTLPAAGAAPCRARPALARTPACALASAQ